jgi:hypothetical protein
MTKERGKTGGAMKGEVLKLCTRADGRQSAAHQRQATQLLATARARDLTLDEQRVLSVVQLSEYATIQRNRQRVKR